jgi:hypothetical protein
MKQRFRRLIFLVAGFSLTAGGVIALRSWRNVAPEERINRLLERARRAAETESVTELHGVFAADYRDAYGNSRSELLGHIQRFFLQSDQLSVRYVKIVHEVSNLPLDAAEASACFHFLISRWHKA